MPIRIGCASDYNKNQPPRKSRDKETIILIANRRFAWVDCDEHILELAPRIPTLDEWKNSTMAPYDWKRFSRKYAAEMKGIKGKKAIMNLRQRSNDGEIIRLICYENDEDPYCHRYVLKLFIDDPTIIQD
jgi:uncharacterized protein YeaO (DUF488 family)